MKEKIRVLLVDDERQFVANMAALLRTRGFHVSSAYNGYEAVDAVKSERFDVIVLDLKMPGMDGLSTMSEIKRLAPDTEVIMLTGHASVSSGIRAIREGAFDYLMKPCDIGHLAETIREAHEREVIRRNPVLWPRERVGEIPLCPFRRIRPEDPLLTALEMLSGFPAEEAIGEIYVLDHEDRLLGILTKRILLEQAHKNLPAGSLTWESLVEAPGLLPQRRVDEVMRFPDLTAGPDALLKDVAEEMIARKLSSVPVIEGEMMLGVIRLKDILWYVEREIE
ncbi:MAG: response regulator [Deltaproteobacteria bacterium]|nr:response regulator [Deltaproteobacteria bacterium]MBW2064823.1 response regulator [Deltaproteobacteria bacterium]